MNSYDIFDKKCAKLLNSDYQTNVPTMSRSDCNMDDQSKYELVTRIEYILNYLLSRKHNMNVKIEFEKEKYLNGNTNQTGNFEKE